MYTLKSAPHKADPTYTVHLNEREADHDPRRRLFLDGESRYATRKQKGDNP